MPTSIGIFLSRDQAEHAVQELVEAQVPHDRISFLTPDSPRNRGKTVGAFLGGAIGTSAGLTLGLGTATLLVPGLGPVVAIGLGAAALLGLGGATAGKSVGAGIDAVVDEERATDLPDAAYFHNVLLQNRSVVVVSTEDNETHSRASAILNRLSLPAQTDEPRRTSQITRRYIDDVLIISLSGRMVLGDANATFHDLIHEAIDHGHRKIVVDMSGVTYIDSSGIGEIVHAHLQMKKAGGQIKLAQLGPKIADLMHTTQLTKVLDIQADESNALATFG